MSDAEIKVRWMKGKERWENPSRRRRRR